MGRDVAIGRDAFARVTLMRGTIPLYNRRGCAVCDGVGRFRYGLLRDDFAGPPDWTTRGFCGIDCYRSYNP
jgi:hypothetical protein